MTTPNTLPYPTDLGEPGAIDALLAYHRQFAGDLRMEDEPAGDPPADDSPAGDPPAGNEPDPSGDEGGKDNDDDSKLDLDGARAELTRVRQEAAKYRTRLRDAEAKLSTAKSPEDVEVALTELREQNAALELSVTRSEVARKFNLPEDLASALQGGDRDALEAHAKVLAKYAPASESGEPRGGLDPTGDDEPFDPVKAARAARRRF